MEYPYGKFRFKVEIEGLQVAGFSEASGFDASIETTDYREGNMVTTAQKVPGLKKYSNITLKKGVGSSMELFNWINAGITGEVQRKTVTITILDQTEQPQASWQIINAYPCKYTAPDFNATSSEVAIESLEIVHEGLVRTK